MAFEMESYGFWVFFCQIKLFHWIAQVNYRVANCLLSEIGSWIIVINTQQFVIYKIKRL